VENLKTWWNTRKVKSERESFLEVNQLASRHFNGFSKLAFPLLIRNSNFAFLLPSMLQMMAIENKQTAHGESWFEPWKHKSNIPANFTTLELWIIKVSLRWRHSCIRHEELSKEAEKVWVEHIECRKDQVDFIKVSFGFRTASAVNEPATVVAAELSPRTFHSRRHWENLEP
jgi:hypothetical protein